ncbi:outer membrane protein assembly factor [Candidatus Riflebacteria bacterium]
MNGRKLYVVVVTVFFFMSQFSQTLSLEAFESNVIVDYQVAGNQVVPEHEILMAVRSKIGTQVSRELIEREVKNVGALGYFSYVGADVKDSDRGKIVIFQVVENPVIKDVRFEGLTQVRPEKILKGIKTRSGSIYNSKVLNEDLPRLEAAFAKAGFPFNRIVDIQVLEKGTKIIFFVSEGKIAKISVEGNDVTHPKVILRELTIKKGDYYNNKKIVRDLQRIFNLGFFEEVKRKHVLGGKPEEIHLVIVVKEQKTGSAGFGGGYSTLNGLVGFLNAKKENFQGRGQRVAVRYEFGGTNSFEFSWFEPWVRNRPISLGVDLFKTQVNRDLFQDGNIVSDYKDHRIGYVVTAGKRFGPDTKTYISFRDEDVEISEVENPELITDFSIRDGRHQTLTLSYDHDSRDNIFRATRGAKDTLTVQHTGGFLKGVDAYTKYTAGARRYFALTGDKKTIVAMQSIWGTTVITKGELPFYNLFSVGGSDTVRGYREREFLGSKMFHTNLELRQTLAKNIDGVLFYDIGDAWNDKYRFKYGFGAGVRLITPIGPLRIDYGKAKDRDESQIYFNFGNAF